MLWLVKNFLHPIRSTCHQYGIPALVCQTSDVRRHFAGKPVVASHVSCFLRLTSARWYEGQARCYSLTWDVTFAAFRTLSIHESWMPSVAAKSSASPIWTPIVFIGETTTCMIAKDELTMKSVILETINNDDDDDDGTLHFASAGKQWFSVVKKELVPRLSQLGLHSLQTIEEKLPTFEITTSFHKFLIYIFIGGNCSKSRCFIMIADDFFVLWEHHNCFRRVKQKEKKSPSKTFVTWAWLHTFFSLTWWWRGIRLWRGRRAIGNGWLCPTVQQVRLLNVLLTQTIPLTKVSTAVLADNGSYSSSVGKSRWGVVHDAVIVIGNAATVDTISVILVKIVGHPCKDIMDDIYSGTST